MHTRYSDVSCTHVCIYVRCRIAGFNSLFLLYACSIFSSILPASPHLLPHAPTCILTALLLHTPAGDRKAQEISEDEMEGDFHVEYILDEVSRQAGRQGINEPTMHCGIPAMVSVVESARGFRCKAGYMVVVFKTYTLLLHISI